MKKQIAMFILAACYTAPGIYAQDTPPHLTLLTEENHPYSLSNVSTGRIEGITVDIVSDLMENTNIEFTLSILPWQRTFRRAQTDKNTCAFPTNRTAEREKLFQWVGPLHKGGWAIYKRPGSEIDIQSAEDILAYTVTGKMGSPSVDSVENATGVTVVRAGNDETAARLLFHGRADLWVSGVMDGPYAAEKAGLPAPELALLWRPAELSLACSKNTDPSLIKLLNQANTLRLEQMKEIMVDSTLSPKQTLDKPPGDQQ
ncbi:MAG: substrate-binding periplasmic protein [Kordiimonas sp.]